MTKETGNPEVDKMYSMLDEVANLCLESTYKKEYSDVKSSEHLNDALGKAIAWYCGWSGKKICDVFYSALEDSNYHKCAEVVDGWLKEM